MEEDAGDYLYNLVGILVHAGVAQGGHYYSYIRDRGKNAYGDGASDGRGTDGAEGGEGGGDASGGGAGSNGGSDGDVGKVSGDQSLIGWLDDCVIVYCRRGRRASRYRVPFCALAGFGSESTRCV